ncbi:MAG: nitrogenase component 1 [Actinobacteria bacterium]|nr:nitrogenase component 1 [Actinomycetota bacterium]
MPRLSEAMIDETESVLQEPMRSSATVGAVSAIYKIQGAFPLIHGPVGCKFLPEFTISWYTDDLIHIACTYMNDFDIIYGATEKLKKAILRTYKDRGPKLLAIIGTDASSMIGDNVDLVIQETQPQTPGMDTIFLDTAGFRGEYNDGVNETMRGLIKHLMKDPQERISGTLNIVGDVAGGEDQVEIRRLLGRMGVGVNAVLTADSTTEQIKGAPRAGANICLTRELGQECAQIMQERFGLPYWAGMTPYGLEATKEWLAQAAVLAGEPANWGGVVQAEYDQAWKDLSEARTALKGKRVGVVGSSDMALPLTRFLGLELGMDVGMVCFTNRNEAAEQELMDLVREGNLNPEVLVQANLFEVEERLELTQLDLLVGSEGERYLAHERGVTVVPVFYPRMMGKIYFQHKIYQGDSSKEAYLGFRGAVNLGARMAKEYANPTIPLK